MTRKKAKDNSMAYILWSIISKLVLSKRRQWINNKR